MSLETNIMYKYIQCTTQNVHVIADNVKLNCLHNTVSCHINPPPLTSIHTFCKHNIVQINIGLPLLWTVLYSYATCFDFTRNTFGLFCVFQHRDNQPPRPPSRTVWLIRQQYCRQHTIRNGFQQIHSCIVTLERGVYIGGNTPTTNQTIERHAYIKGNKMVPDTTDNLNDYTVTLWKRAIPD